jgi:ABC-type proline/glycine betaine transport system substrate-binding protein
MGCCVHNYTSLQEEAPESSEIEDLQHLEKIKTQTTADIFGADSSSSVVVLEVIQDSSVKDKTNSARISLF